MEKKLANLKSLENRSNNNYLIQKNNNDIAELNAKLKQKEKEIEHLNNQLIGSIKYKDLKLGDKIIAVNFTSSDSKINFPIICKNNSPFSEIERILYKKYPDFAENDGEDNFFLANGIKMRRFKTMEENGFPGYGVVVMKRNLDN